MGWGHGGRRQTSRHCIPVDRYSAHRYQVRCCSIYKKYMQVRFHTRAAHSSQPAHPCSSPAFHTSSPVSSLVSCASPLKPRAGRTYPHCRPLVSSRTKSCRREIGWETLITSGEIALLELNTVSDAQAGELAQLCLFHAQAHAEAVKRVLYFNSNVRQAAGGLLGESTPCKPGTRHALALCILDAGFELPQQPHASDVVAMLAERSRADNAHWSVKRDKHGLYDDQHRHLRVPYFFTKRGPKKPSVPTSTSRSRPMTSATPSST